MKQGKRIAGVLLATMLGAVSLFPVTDVEAGVNKSFLGTDSLATSDWNNPEGDVVVEEDVLIFPADSTDYTRFIAKNAISQSEDFKELLDVSATINFKKLPSGKTFSMAFGLPGIESVSGEAGSVEVVFSNQGGIKVGVVAYDESGNAVTVAKPTACGMTMNQGVAVAVSIAKDGTITVSVNGAQKISAKLPVSGEGRFGFLQTGTCAAEITQFKLVSYKYERPENTNFVEDFETGAMDISKLTAKLIADMGIYPGGQSVEDYNGNQVLMFRNTNNAYVSTVCQYSNFELTFDVPFIKTLRTFDENGNMTESNTQKIVVAFGSEEAKFSGWSGWKNAAEAVAFSYYNVESANYKDAVYQWVEETPFAGDGTPFSIRLRAVDGVLSVAWKPLAGASYKEVLSYNLTNGMPAGYISIWAEGQAYFAIDNIKVTNLDENPALVDIEYVSGKIEKPEDVVYTPMERVYASEKAEKETVSYWFVVPAGVAVVGGISLIILAISGKKKQKRKEMGADESKES